MKLNLQKLTIGTAAHFKVGEAPPEHASLQVLDDHYIVLLINMTDLVIQLGCWNYNPNGHNNWFAFNAIGRTCSQDYDTCFAQQKWQPVVSINCHDATADLSLVTKEGRGATWRVSPNCSFAGGVIGLT